MLEAAADKLLTLRYPRAGCAATVAALLGASSALQKGNRNQFNKYLRLRVAAQGVTIIAALGACRLPGPSRFECMVG